MHQMQNELQLKLDVQANGVEVNDYLKRKIYNMIKKLKRLLPEVNWMDVYMTTNEEKPNPRTIVFRMGIPGNDVVASDSGSQWKHILKNIEKRVIRQLEKKKLTIPGIMK